MTTNEVESEQCICGHPKAYHNSIHRYCMELWPPNSGWVTQPHKCDCRRYRPVLDWPNAEGYWAMSRPLGELPWQPVIALNVAGEYEICMIGFPGTLKRGTTFAKNVQGLARFTKCEPNPFEPTTK